MHSKKYRPVVAAVDQYFQNNKISSHSIAPIPITRIKSSGWGFSQAVPSSGLLNAVESIIGKTISIQEFDSNEAPSVDGMLIEENDKAIIFVNRGLNFCWRRFFVAKELTHLLMNHGDSTCRASSYEDVKGVIEDFFTGALLGSSIEHRKTEHEALVIAVELLLPKQIKDLTYNPPLTPREIAEKVKIPERMILIRINPQNEDYFQSEIYQKPWYSAAIIYERMDRAK